VTDSMMPEGVEHILVPYELMQDSA